MIDLKDYKPVTTEFKLPKDTHFPRTIFQGAKSIEEVKKMLVGSFVSEDVTSVSATRFLDDHEISSIRANYSELIEDKQPTLEAALEAAKTTAKEIVENAKAKLSSVLTQVKDLAAQAKCGETNVEITEDVIRIPINGYYLFYAWTDEDLKLCKVEKIPTWEAQNLFVNFQTNRTAFRDVLGIDIPEDEQAATQEREEE